MLRIERRDPFIAPFADRLKGFDVIQSWELFTDWSEQAVLAKERFGIPLSVMVWDNIPFNMESSQKQRELKKRVGDAADALIVHTERSRRTLDIEGFDSDKVVKIAPGVDLDMFSPGQKQNVSDSGTFTILFVGWLLPRKGIDFLLMALRELLQDSSLSKHKICLKIVGSGPGKPRVQKLISRLGIDEACTFEGSKSYDAMPDVYRSADLFVLPSIPMAGWQEQFGMSLIEAMACGTPVISTLSGAIPEIAGDAALLCQPNDFLSLYESIRKVIQEPALRDDLSKAGRSRVEDKFNLGRFSTALSDIYNSLLI